MPPSNPKLIAVAVVAVGLAGTVIDPNGVVGVILFSAAAAALLYLLGRPATRLVAAVVRPAGRFRPRRVPLVLRPRAIAGIAVASGALLGATNLFDENGDAMLGRVLNDASFLGGFMLSATIALVLLGTAVRWTRTAFVAAPA